MKTAENRAHEILRLLTARGVAVEAIEGRLRLTPAASVDAEIRGRVAARKAEILRILAGDDGGTCEPLKHDPVPTGVDGRGWTKFSCSRCGRFSGYAPARALKGV